MEEPDPGVGDEDGRGVKDVPLVLRVGSVLRFPVDPVLVSGIPVLLGMLPVVLLLKLMPVPVDR